MIQMSNSGLMTIDRFNKLTGHETLHPLICMGRFVKNKSKRGYPDDVLIFTGCCITTIQNKTKYREKSGCD